jgi:hypothetical protein
VGAGRCPTGARSLESADTRNLNWDVHRIDGVIDYYETGARGNCASAPIRFGVSR